MPIRFEIDKSGKFFTTTFEGVVKDEEVRELYPPFFEGGGWRPGMSELADLSAADFSQVSPGTVHWLAKFFQELYERHGVTATRAAIYAPHDLPFGLARMYEAFAGESPERVHIFRDLSQARLWIEGTASDQRKDE